MYNLVILFTTSVIDIAKLNVRDGFLPNEISGFNKYMPDPTDPAYYAGSSSNTTTVDYKHIFNSPYFDYRKTHSRVMTKSRKINYGVYFVLDFRLAVLWALAAMEPMMEALLIQKCQRLQDFTKTMTTTGVTPAKHSGRVSPFF